MPPKLGGWLFLYWGARCVCASSSRTGINFIKSSRRVFVASKILAMLFVDGQREMVYQQTLQLRAYERPTVEMLQKSVELCARMRHQCDMWYMAYRDIYADMPLIKSTVRDMRRFLFFYALRIHTRRNIGIFLA